MCENVVHGTEHDHENRKNGRMCLQSSTMSEHIEITPEIIEIRHYLHAHPERSFKEYETSAYIEKLLRAHDIEVLNNPLETGVVGLIRGDQPGPRIALRADIDGLPIQEDTGLPFSSVNDGVMHGCGHDLHMSYMLGAAFWLAKRRKHIKGSIKLLFQPAEELGLGAKAMVDAGLLADVSAAIGAHNNPNYAPGQIAVGPEPMMAGCVKFHVTLHATGTHAGYPHKGTGPIEALATMVLALQTIVSRNVSPFHPLVLSITEMHGGHVWNVVPDKASFQGTVRYFHKSDGELVEKRFKQQVHCGRLRHHRRHRLGRLPESARLRYGTFQDSRRQRARLRPARTHPPVDGGGGLLRFHARHHACVRLHRIQRRGRLPGLAQPALRRS